MKYYIINTDLKHIIANVSFIHKIIKLDPDQGNQDCPKTGS